MILEGTDVFVEVVEAKGFAAAARRLGMPTSTVSAKIARLEAGLGVTLLHRTTRKLSVTEAGARYYEHCAKALAELAEGQRALARRSEEPSGRLRLTAPADLSQMLLPEIVAQYLERFPKVSLELVVSNQHEDLVGDKFDLAIRAGALKDTSQIARRFARGWMSLWAAPSYLEKYGSPTTPEELQKHRIVGFRAREDAQALTLPDGRQFYLDGKTRLDLDDLQTSRRFIEQGLGIGLLPVFGVKASPEMAGLAPVLPGAQTRAIQTMFVYPRQSFVPPTVRSFIDLASDLLRSQKIG